MAGRFLISFWRFSGNEYLLARVKSSNALNLKCAFSSNITIFQKAHLATGSLWESYYKAKQKCKG